ncbi:MAG: DUF3181 family protein [Spirulina sp.]
MASAGSSRAIEALAAAIGDQAYIDVAKWHLYLGDAKLHTSLAERIYPLIDDGTFDESALMDVLASFSVALGGGKKTVSLADLIPSGSQADLLRAIEDYQRDR